MESPIDIGYLQKPSDINGISVICHAEGRGFESLQPLSQKAPLSRGFLLLWVECTKVIAAGATTRRYQIDRRSFADLGRAASGRDRCRLISATRPTKQLRLRRPDQCRVCSIELPIGTTAIWDPGARTVACLDCGGDEVAAGPAAPIDSGQAGASALRKHQGLHEAREQRAREKLGGLGAFLTKVIDEPSSTRVWQQGGNGEVRVAARLEKLLGGSGVRLLHDRRVPGHGQANIDHIAVGPGGVTVIDAKFIAERSGATGKADCSPSDGRSSASTAATRPS